MTERRCNMAVGILKKDPYLMPFEKDINLRTKLYAKKRKELLTNGKKLSTFANGHKYFGFHRTRSGWVYREWAPAADEMYLTGDFNGWNIESHQLHKLENGIFEIHIKGKNTLKSGDKVQAVIISSSNVLRIIPNSSLALFFINSINVKTSLDLALL